MLAQTGVRMHTVFQTQFSFTNNIAAQPTEIAGTRDRPAVRISDNRCHSGRCCKIILDSLDFIDIKQIYKSNAFRIILRLGQRGNSSLQQLIRFLAAFNIKIDNKSNQTQKYTA